MNKINMISMAIDDYSLSCTSDNCMVKNSIISFKNKNKLEFELKKMVKSKLKNWNAHVDHL